LKAVLDVGNDRVDLDWTDAGSGSLGIDAIKGKDRVDNALKVRFRNETAVIDPTIVSSSSNNDPTGYATQRKVSWYGGYIPPVMPPNERCHGMADTSGCSTTVVRRSAIGPASTG
jgi:hypothetical protein